MNRIGIFVFYDADGIVDKYVENLLKSLISELQELVIVINGSIQSGDRNLLRKYANRIFQRENIGFDGGAYKDIFTSFLKGENWERWDEIVLFNDTFYSGFYSWKDIFNLFENEKVDFWGLTHHDLGKFPDGEVIKKHLQTYFVVIRKSMFKNNIFKYFWECLSYPRTYREAITEFEIYFTTYFEKFGFVWKSWLDLKNISQQMDCSKNIYISECDKLIINYHFPILKRRAISIVTWKQSFRVLEYMKINLEYDVKDIQNHINRLSDKKRIKPFDFKTLEQFCTFYNKVYIYGGGIIGNAVKEYLEYKGFIIAGFLLTVVSDGDEDLTTIQFDKYEPKESDGIIIALNQKNFNEVYSSVRKKCSKMQILLPEYDN